jgi:hypothetical protein
VNHEIGNQAAGDLRGEAEQREIDDAEAEGEALRGSPVVSQKKRAACSAAPIIVSAPLTVRG